MGEVVDTACEATMIPNDLTSTPSVLSSLVLGLLHDNMPTLDESIPPMGKPMAMVDDDTPPTWFHEDEDDNDWILDTSPTTHERHSKGNIGDVASLVPLVDSLDIDCSHDVDPPIHMLHASETSSCLDLPIYDEYDDEHVELPSCDAMLHRISCEKISLVTSCLIII